MNAGKTRIPSLCGNVLAGEMDGISDKRLHSRETGGVL